MSELKETIVVSFSGGKTSAYMSQWLIKDYGHLYSFVFIFANTGQECEETLIFVDKCDKEFGLNVVWIEAVVNPIHGKGITHKVVNFKSAARNGEPFEAFIAKSGIPNANKPQCSDRLKALPIEHYKKVNGLKGARHCIGIRKDEERRKAKSASKYNLIYPLCDWTEIDKLDVNIFWEMQSFTLELKDHQGNCKTCWKKSDKKLWLLTLESPKKFKFMRDMEKKYQHVKPNDNGQQRLFFRKNRSVDDLFKESELMDEYTLNRLIGYKDDQDSGCSESCEAYAGDELA
jgi:3'-phosphoadenosine 5'-phosphosulfate sulfotransferase (PAPS reductase)/FAD synthetase